MKIKEEVREKDESKKKNEAKKKGKIKKWTPDNPEGIPYDGSVEVEL